MEVQTREMPVEVAAMFKMLISLYEKVLATELSSENGWQQQAKLGLDAYRR